MKAQYSAPVRDFDLTFWRYTLKDLIRIGVPASVGWAVGNFLIASSLTGVAGLLGGLTLGLALAETEYSDKHLDEYLTEYLAMESRRGSRIPSAVDEVRDDGAVLKDGGVVGVVKVSSVDLGLVSDRAERRNMNAVLDLCKEIEHPVTIHSRQRFEDVSRYEGVNDQQNATVTDHYVTTRITPTPDLGIKDGLTGKESGDEPQTVEGRLEELEKRCTTIRQQLTSGDLYAERVTGDELETFVDRFDCRFNAASIDGSYRARNRYSIIDGHRHQVRRMLYVSEYPEELGFAWLSDVLNTETPGFVDTIQVIDPLSEKERVKLGRISGRLDIELATESEPVRRSELLRKKEDLEDLLDAESRLDEKLLEYSVCIVASGSTREEADETFDAITSVLREKGIKYREPTLRPDLAAQTDAVFHRDALDEKQVALCQSVAATFSFSTHDMIEENGGVIGTDDRNGLPVILDRFGLDAPHLAKMGKPGSGKTYHTFLTLLRLYRKYIEKEDHDSLRIRIIDPKPDYGRIVDWMDGKTVVLDQIDLDSIDRELDSDVVRFVVSDSSQSSWKLFTTAVQAVHREGVGNHQKTLVVIDEAHRLLTRGSDEARTAIETLVREGRMWNMAVTLATQSAEDFQVTRAGRNIVKNSDCFMFFKHNEFDDIVPDFFHLPKKQSDQLGSLRTGRNLPFSEALIRGPVNTKLKIESTPEEHRIITEEEKQ